MSNLVKWTGYTQEDAEQDAKELGKTGYFKAEVGRNKVRFLPGRPGSRALRIVQQHAVEVPGAKFPIRFACPGAGCPACIESARLSRTGNLADKDAAYELSAKPRIFANVIDRANPDRGPMVFEFGKKIHGALKLLLDPDVCGDFTSPVDGTDILIQRTGTGKEDTKYEVSAARQSSPLAESVEQMNEWLETMPDLEKFAAQRTPEEIRKLLGGSDEKPQRKAPPKKRTAQDDVIEGEFTEE